MISSKINSPLCVYMISSKINTPQPLHFRGSELPFVCSFVFPFLFSASAAATDTTENQGSTEQFLICKRLWWYLLSLEFRALRALNNFSSGWPIFMAGQLLLQPWREHFSTLIQLQIWASPMLLIFLRAHTHKHTHIYIMLCLHLLSFCPYFIFLKLLTLCKLGYSVELGFLF